MKIKIILFLTLTLFSCSTKTKEFLPIQNSMILNNKCLWAKGITKEKVLIYNTRQVSIYYCCPNKDIDSKKNRPLCVESKFLFYR